MNVQITLTEAEFDELRKWRDRRDEAKRLNERLEALQKEVMYEAAEFLKAVQGELHGLGIGYAVSYGRRMRQNIEGCIDKAKIDLR